MRYFSTFSGIGGFELGIKQAYESIQKLRLENKGQPEGSQTGSEERRSKQLSKLSLERLSCVGYSELDKYAVQIYQKHFPEHKNYGDITKINTSDLPEFELLVGGFPCQSFSIAGKRGGFNDTRGTLFFEIARILRDKKPRLLLLENVKGLLSHEEGKTFATIVSTLDELGYDLQWQVLNSKNHGVPQNRERVFIVGHIRGTPRPEVFPFGESHERNTESQREAREERQRIRGDVASTLASRDYKGGGNLIQLNQPTHSNDRVYDDKGISPTLNTMQGGNRQPKILVPEATRGGYSEATIGDSINLSQMNSKTRRGRVGKGVAQTLDTGMQQYTIQPTTNVDTGPIWSTFPNGMQIRRLTPIECERLQGFPDGWTEGVSDTQRYKTLGNAVTVNVIEDIFKRIFS